jgi:hypothetical protein
LRPRIGSRQDLQGTSQYFGLQMVISGFTFPNKPYWIKIICGSQIPSFSSKVLILSQQNQTIETYIYIYIWFPYVSYPQKVPEPLTPSNDGDRHSHHWGRSARARGTGDPVKMSGDSGIWSARWRLIDVDRCW